MLPLRDKVKSLNRPYLVYGLILVNTLVFLYQLTLTPESLRYFFYEYGVVPYFLENEMAWELRGPLDQLLPFLTSMFLHGGWLHIIGNMWILFVFGDNVEDRMGRRRFIIFYLLAGIASMTVHAWTNAGSQVPAIGASGAIAGVMGAYLIYFPRAQVVTLLPIFFYFTIVTVPASLYLLIWFGLQFLNGTFSLINPVAGGGIAWWAHVGGFAFGVLTAKLFQRSDSIGIDINIMRERFYID